MEAPDHTNQKFLVLEIKPRASNMLDEPYIAEQHTSPSLLVYVCIHVCAYVLKIAFVLAPVAEGFHVHTPCVTQHIRKNSQQVKVLQPNLMT